MSFLVVYLSNSASFLGPAQESRVVIESLDDIKTIRATAILEVWEVSRRVPLELKYRAEKEIIKQHPYYEIDGAVTVDKANLSGTTTINAEPQLTE